MAHFTTHRQPPFLSLLTLVLVSWLLLQPATPALAQTALPATQDTFVDPNNATTNYDGQRLELAYSNFPTLTGTRRVLLQFDLRAVTGSLSTAPLVLTTVENNFPTGATLTLGLYALPDSWTESAVTFTTQPAVGAPLQTVAVAAGSTGPMRFNAAAVGAYLEAQRTGDGVASFLLQLDAGSGTLGFGGNLFLEDREGSSDGLTGNEPAIEAPTAPSTATPTSTVAASTATTTATPTNTTAAPTATPTATATNTTAAPTATPTATATNTTAAPTATATNPVEAPTPTPTATATATTAAPTATTTATPTNTTTAPTATATNTVEAPPATTTATPTNTTEVPTATPTNTTAVSTATVTPTNTNTVEAPTPTSTHTTEAPTATPTATNTLIPTAPTATPTNTTAAPTPTSTSTAAVPTATPTATNTLIPTAPTATSTSTLIPTAPTATATATSTFVPTAPTATPTATPSSQTIYYLSSASNSKVAGINYQDEDILRYQANAGWSMLFDGSDVGLAQNDLDAFHIMADGSFLMSFEKPMVMPPVGRVDDADILRFVPISLGVNTIGRFSLYFDGSDVGLTTANEDIDALSLDGAGNLVISTAGTVKVDGVAGQDEDLLTFIPTSLGEHTAGRWELLLDGSALNLRAGSEDLNALWIDPAQGNGYLATKGDFAASGSQNAIGGDRNDLFGCTPLDPSCFFFAVFDGDLVGFKVRIDGVSLDLQGNSFILPPVTAAGDEWPDPATQFEVLPDAPVEVDAEYDEFDQPVEDEQLSSQLFLPLINR